MLFEGDNKMKIKYKIWETKAKDSIDGKQHFRILKRVPCIVTFTSENWAQVEDKSYDTYEEAERALKKFTRRTK